MSVTKNFRDGALFVVGDLSDCTLSNHQAFSRLFQNGVWYKFYIILDTGVYYLRRQLSNNPLDGNSVTAANVLTLGATPAAGNHVCRIADNLWYCVFHRDGGGGSADDIWITRSTDQGATWTAPVKIIDNGAAWCASYLRYPTMLVDTVGAYYYLYAIGDGDKIGAFRCPAASDPLTAGNWSALAGNPLYDSPNAGLFRGRFVKYGDKIVYCGCAYLWGSATSPYCYAFEAPGFAQPFVLKNSIVTYDFGAVVTNPVIADVVFNPQDGLWYAMCYYAGHYETAWCGESPLVGMSRIPAAAPDYWTAGIAKGVQFVEAGMSINRALAVQEVSDRGAIHSLRNAGGGLDAEFTFKLYDDFDTLLDFIFPTASGRTMGDAILPALVVTYTDEDAAAQNYIIIPDAECSVKLGEGDEADMITVTARSPRQRPCMGVLNSGALGQTSIPDPGGEDPEDIDFMEE